jgi:Carboxylesterase family
VEYDPQYTGQILNATAERPVCMQGFPVEFPVSGENDLPASEDCLFADVLAPVDPESDLVPVIVHIHGRGILRAIMGMLHVAKPLSIDRLAVFVRGNPISTWIVWVLVLSLAGCTNLECLPELPETQWKAVSDKSYTVGYLLPGRD